jgi:aspartate ammonia-lyase
LGENHASLKGLITHLGEINLGATAIGTGIAADPRYAEAARKYLAAITGYKIVSTTDVGVFKELSELNRRG